jgi:hypothetical protein
VAGPAGTRWGEHGAQGEVLLSGYLWKRGAHWLSFAYHRRYFYLQGGALVYLSQGGGGAAAANGAGGSPPDSHPGETGSSAGAECERRIRLASIVNIRVSSKVKFEFELACADRAYRLRAPSAHALALWVTTISNEWMGILQREAAIGPVGRHALTAAAPGTLTRARLSDMDTESLAALSQESTAERPRSAAAASPALKHLRA